MATWWRNSFSLFLTDGFLETPDIFRQFWTPDIFRKSGRIQLRFLAFYFIKKSCKKHKFSKNIRFGMGFSAKKIPFFWLEKWKTEWGRHFSGGKTRTKIFRFYPLIIKVLHEIKAFETAFSWKISIVVGQERFFLLLSTFCPKISLKIYISKHKELNCWCFKM